MLLKKISGTHEIEFQGKMLNFKAPWQRKSMAELVEAEIGVNFMDIDENEAKKLAKEHKLKIEENDGWGKILSIFFEEKVEHKLIQPTHITDFPTEISPLAKVSQKDPRITERFESYVNGWEICNGFSELNDPTDQLARFEEQAKALESGDEEAHHVDHDFINALEHAMPPVGGLGIGIDRLIMVLTDSPSIREVIAFPTLKPKHV